MGKANHIASKSSRRASGRPRDPATLETLKRLGLPADFPLSPHAPSGRWYKKIRGQRHYFGKLSDPQAALDLYLDQRDDLNAGRNPRKVSAGGVIVADVCNAFLAAKRLHVDSGEMTGRSWFDYYTACQAITRVFGRGRAVVDLRPEDFGALRAEFEKRCGAHALAGRVQRVRSVFKFAYDTGMIPAPALLGPGFKRPKPRAMRAARAAKPAQLFDAPTLRKLIDAADAALKAMILLGINCGLGNDNIARLPMSALDLDKAVLNFPRPKTGIPRRAILWPETVRAIREAINVRPAPVESANDDLVFITKYGRPWIRRELRHAEQGEGGKAAVKLHNVDAVGLQFRKLCKAQEVQLNRFYALRHTFATIAEQTRDFPAVETVMGHEDSNRMATRYREGIGDDRLRAVSEYVRRWLGLATEAGKEGVIAKIG